MSAAPAIASPAPAAAPGRGLSPSQVSTYLDCPARWYFRYALELPAPATGSMALGTAVHAAIAAALEARADGASYSADELAALYEQYAARELAAADLRSEEDPVELTRQGAALVELYAAQALPHIQPAAVEQPLAGAIGGIPVHGIADAITAAGQVLEIKTSSRRPAGIRAEHQLQATTYAMLSGCDEARIDTLVRTKTPQYVRHTLAVDDTMRRHAETLYPLVADAIATEIYPPHRASVLCSRRNCAHWRACQAEFGGTVDE